MLDNSEASNPGNLTAQSLIHDVAVSHNTCILKDELRRTTNGSYDEHVPSAAAKTDRENELVQQPTVHILDMFVCIRRFDQTRLRYLHPNSFHLQRKRE